jgi:actin-related protein
VATDPAEILNRRNAEVAQIRGYADLTEEAKQRRIAEVNERAQAQYAEAREAEELERAKRLEKSKKAVFRVPIPAGTTDAEEAQIHVAYRQAYNDVYFSTRGLESPEQAQEELERHLHQAERAGDKLLAQATYHRAIDLGIQGIVDAYLATRPNESKAWESYTAAYQEVSQSKDILNVLGRGLTERAFSSEATG